MIKFILTAFFFLISAFVSAPTYAADIASCDSSSGHAYYALRGLTDEKDVGWNKDKISDGKFTFNIDEEGNIDILVTDATKRVFSSVSEGAQIIPATISEEAVTIIVLYPNALVETYALQKLKSGKYQAMYTQVKTETPFPKVSALVADCSYLNLAALQR